MTRHGHRNTSASGLDSPQAIAISPDGDNVYVVARDSHGFGTIAEFARNPSDGSLTQLSPNDYIAENPQQYDTSSVADRSSGRFRSRGRFAAGTVRGTRWTTSDRCDGTLIAVQLHSVVIYDFVKQFFLLLPQGHSYLAGPHTPPPPESEELTEPHNEGGESPAGSP